jgi:proteic killer suppression protein
MIKSFNSKDAALIWSGEGSRRFGVDVQNVARRKLRILNGAKQLNDLRIPPGNRLEALKGNRAGEYSIRVNDQWRICFKWLNGDVHDVTVEDYH